MKKNRKIPCEVYSRISGFYRPVNQWNVGKKSEFHDRKLVPVKKIIKRINYDKL